MLMILILMIKTGMKIMMTINDQPNNKNKYGDKDDNIDGKKMMIMAIMITIIVT